MTRHAEGFVIARGLGPLDPPTGPLIEVSGGGLLVPGGGYFGFGRIEVIGYRYGIIGSSGARFRAPTDANGSGYKPRRDGDDSLRGGVHIDSNPTRRDYHERWFPACTKKPQDCAS